MADEQEEQLQPQQNPSPQAPVNIYVGGAPQPPGMPAPQPQTHPQHPGPPPMPAAPQAVPQAMPPAPQGLPSPQPQAPQKDDWQGSAGSMPQEKMDQEVSSQDMPEEKPAQTQPKAQAAAPAQAQPKSYNDYYRAHKAEWDQENAKWAQDLNNQHITPETYHTLFAKKDTLGKIGTLFGLLMSGAGSGLTHQPNAVLNMMDNTIKNDLDAQKQSKQNAQNFLTLTSQNEMRKAEAGQINTQTGIANYNLAQARMLQTSFAAQVQQVNNMPEGPQKEAAKQGLGVLYLKIGDKINNLGQAAAGAEAAAHIMGGGGAGNANLLRVTGQEGLANSIEAHNISGVPEVAGQSASQPIPQDKRDQIVAMQTLSDKGKDLLDFARKHKGSLDPQTLKVGRQKAEEMMNFYNNSIQGGVLTEGRLAWLDKQIKKNPTSIFQDILGNNKQLEEIVNSNDTRKGMILKGLGFNPKTKSGGSESPRMSKSGKPIVLENGKWVYKQ